MGKQKGEAARTKARPSSSGLAASLLPSSAGGAAAFGFGGYVGSSRLSDSSPSTNLEALDIDGELAQHVKRLARKDPTTKVKALATLSALLKDKSAKDVVPIIPQWAFEYKKLLQDYNREIRRATNDTMANLVSVVGRDLAPHLKTLMGPWWFSQFDAVHEVSQAAKRSFQAAFSTQEKRLDALMLCTDEVFVYLGENLKLTPESMSDKAVALDELQEMHQQVISSSLLALATLLDILTSEKGNSTSTNKHALKARSTAISHAEKLLSVHNSFTDFLKSHIPKIRSAAYSLVRSCVKNIPHILNEANIKTLAPAILGAFQEKDSTCHSSMWEAVLLFSRKFPESWSTLNVNKSVFSRLWNFLRNGCFGSQQVSYPALVLYLECVSPKVITADKFFLEFFQSFWAGKVHSQFSDADQLAFFQSYRECFLWVLQNAQRYCDGVDASHNFQCTIVNEVLLKLLWHDYLLIPSSEENMKQFEGNYRVDHVQVFGKCFTEILSGIFSLEPDLLSIFCLTFEENCLDAFKKSEDIQSQEKVEKIIRFLLVVDVHVQKGDSWPLSCLVGPMLAKSFQLIQNIDSTNAVKFMVVAVSTFGPRKVVQQIVREQNEPKCQSEESNRDMSSKEFLQQFKEVFVPWCLQTNSHSMLARLDLLLALLDEECFREQWDSIIRHATSKHDSNYTCILALLMEKTREEITRKKLTENSKHVHGVHLNHWHHELLDSTALAIACSFSAFGSSDARFICAALGGETEENQTYLVDENTSVLIFEEILRKLKYFIGTSTFTWIRGANVFLDVEEHVTIDGCESSKSVLEMVNFAMGVLNGSFFRLKTLSKSYCLLPGILAALFVIDWEYSALTVVYNGHNNNPDAKEMDRFSFCKYAHVFRSKVNNFLQTIGPVWRKTLGSILVQAIRYGIFNEDNRLGIDNVSSLGCLYVQDVLDSVCQGHAEEQTFLEELLDKGDSWPSWVMPGFKDGERLAILKHEVPSSTASESDRVVAFVDKLISRLGIDRVILGSISCKPSSNKVMPSDPHYPRVWLAAEMLCTWKWHGGSALASFLPSLIRHTRDQNFSPSDSLLDHIVKILLDGALVQGANSMSFSSIYPAPHDDLESIEQEFVRALVSVLHRLFEDVIWGRDKALEIFNLLLDRLFVGEAVNSNSLNILAVIMSVLIGPLSSQASEIKNNKTDSSEDNQIHHTFEGWLQKTLSYPSLNTWKSGEDMEDWFQLVVSCYPLRASRGMQNIKPQRSITHMERGLLLELFRKQRLGSATSILVNKLPVVQMLLSKLTVVVVGYCWIDFNEDDWEFVLYKSRYWIESTVVLMEEVAESVNETITGEPTSDILGKLQHTVSCLDSSPLKLARNALIAFSLFCGLVGKESVIDENENENEDINVNDRSPLRLEKWDLIKDRILEGILRLFFSTGAAEAIAGSYSSTASLIIASARLDDCYFWELVASSAVASSSHARDRAMKSFEIWGLSKGAVSSLYAILFSLKPVPCLQFAAYVILSSEPVADSAFITQEPSSSLEENDIDYKDPLNSSICSKIPLREEISVLLEKSPFELIEMDLVAPERVRVFLAWSLLISYLLSSPSSSTREKLIQHIEDSSISIILDCIFQHIPLELCSASVKKKLSELPPVISDVAKAATRSIVDNSVLFAVETLWPVGPDGMASFAGAIYGLMLRTLPAYVRNWFNDIRDRTSSSAIESFTRTWCSPPLITNELSQIKKANLSDENFSVSVSKSANEVVATYRKDETGMDLVVRLPSSYSLRPVDVECTRSLGISEVKQRKWLLSMMSFVRNQNGALAEAIRIWKSNFDKEFEGVEDCPICYSVIHTANHTLPRLACRTCKYKFHSVCLYKWFNTSHKSNCPLCQSPF